MSVFDTNFIVERVWDNNVQPILYKRCNKGVEFSEKLHLIRTAEEGSPEYEYFRLNPGYHPSPMLICYQDYDLISKRLEIIYSGLPEDCDISIKRPTRELADSLGITQYVTKDKNSWRIYIDPTKPMTKISKFSSGSLSICDITLESNMSEEELKRVGIYEDLMDYLRWELVSCKIQISRLLKWK